MTYKKTEHFEPIAMKCTKDQFESIKPILEQFYLYPENIENNWKEWNYLKNNGTSNKFFITNIRGSWKSDNNRIVYKTFNAETFLKACGIVSEPLYQLTAKEVVHAYENPQWLRDTFKECFETELEVNRWIKDDTLPNYLSFFTDNGIKYGFDLNGKWYHSKTDLKPSDDKRNRYATESEVKEALVKEAIKRGYKEGVTFNNAYESEAHDKNSGLVGSRITFKLNDEYNGLHTNNQWIFYKILGRIKSKGKIDVDVIKKAGQ